MQIYACFIALFVFLSIFAFVAGTHHYFQVDSGNRTINLSIPLPEPPLDSNNRLTTTSSNDSQSREIWAGLEYIDYVCVAFFTIDMILRLISAPDRSHFLCSTITLIEIIAIIPYYFDFAAHLIDTSNNERMKQVIDIVHVLRIFGVLRILKILRYYSGLQVLVYTLRSSYKDLLLMLTFIGVATLFFSSLIYYVDDQRKFTSIPAGFWWSIVTMTTVGYGDFYPTKTGGYIIGSACALVGVLVVAFTVPILVNSFMLYYSHAQSILTYKEEGTLKINSDNERAYLDYTFNTLKRLSFHSLMPKMPDLRPPVTVLPTTNKEEDSNHTIGGPNNMGSSTLFSLNIEGVNDPESVELENIPTQSSSELTFKGNCYLAPPDPFCDIRKVHGENGKLTNFQNHI